ncbi:MAG: response regulator transcription factor [Myxococcales bacterium]|nr:response regulator transcription factor [Myxococcales bacterium]
MDHLRRLLLVDDEEVFAKSTSRMLDKQGYQVETAHDADHASELLRQKTYDCVISDVRMPGNTRFEFIEDLAEAKDSPPVVVITAYPSVDTAVKSLDLRISSYLVKPIEIDDLLSRVEDAIREVRTRRAANKLMSRAGTSAEAEPPAPPAARSDGPDPEKLASLSPRETEVLRHLLEGYRVNTIARKLFISQHTVRNHLKKIFAKLEVRSQTELMEKLKP